MKQVISAEQERRFRIHNAIAYIIDLWEDDVAIEDHKVYRDILARYGLSDITYGEERFINEAVSRAIGQ